MSGSWTRRQIDGGLVLILVFVEDGL